MSDTKYLETHEWYIVSENTITVGISDFAQGELGDIVFVTLPEVGQEFSKGDAIVEVEATKTVAEAYAPMDCVITEVNSNLEIVFFFKTGSSSTRILLNSNIVLFLNKFTFLINKAKNNLFMININ